MARRSTLLSGTNRRAAQQRAYKKKVLNACNTWRPGLIARSLKKNKRKKE